MPAASIVSAIVGGAGDALASGFQAMALGEQKDQIDEQKAQIREQAARDAANTRERGARIASSQYAALSAAGVELDDTGTSKALLAETSRLTEKDVLSIMTTAHNQIKLLNMQKDALTHSQQKILMANSLVLNSAAAKVSSGVGQYLNSTNSSQAANQVTLDANSYYSNKIPKYSLLGDSSSSSSSLLGS